MRRLTAALLAVPLAATAVLAGCSSSSPSAAQAGSNESVRVSGAEGKAPTVHIPASKADTALVTKTVVHGKGAKLAPGDSYLANFDVFVWRGKTNKLLFSSFTSTPEVLPVTMGLTGLAPVGDVFPEEVTEAMEARFLEKTRAEWLEILRAADVPVGPETAA